MSNGDSKILKTGIEQGEASVQQKYNSNGVESSHINSATEEIDGNETDVSGREVEGKEELSGSMRLAVVLSGFPSDKMTEEQAEVLGTALVEKINSTSKGEPIQFSATKYENGGLVLTCVNKATKVWLHKTVPKIVPWPGAKLAVGQAETTLKGAKFVLWVMMGMNKKSNQQILDFFQKQNEDISTAEWRIVRRVTETDERQRIILWVDDKSSEDLKAHNYKLFLGLARPKFLQLSEWKKQTAEYFSTKQQAWFPAVRNSVRPPAFPSFSRPRGRGFSGPNLRPQISRFDRQNRPPHRGSEFAGTDTRHFRGVREGRYTGPAVLQNRESRVSPSERYRERGFGVSERSQLRGDGYVVSNRGMRPRENNYFPPNRNRLEKPVFGDSYRPSSGDSRFRDLDDPPFQESRFRGSDRMQSRGDSFVERDTSYSRESGSRMSDPRRFRDFGSTVSRVSRSWEDRFSDSNFQSQQSRSYYTNSTRSRFSRPSGSGRAKW